MDTLIEKANTISRCGSFYYQTLEDEQKDIAEFISHVTWYNKIPSKLKHIEEALKGGSFFLSYYDVIKFSDNDVSWRGIKDSLQFRLQGPAVRKENDVYTSAPDTTRYPGRLGNLEIPNSVVAEANKEQEYTATENKDIILYPDTSANVIIDNTTIPKWDLNIDPNIYVISIIINGKVLITGQDFESGFGKITFLENPLKLFPSKKILVLCSQIRFKNIYNYIIGATNVYGDISYILKYYRESQTVRLLKLACAQFSGMTVVKEQCKIINVIENEIGATYVTNKGIIEALYNHKLHKPGTIIDKDSIIGGDSLFNIYSTYDSVKNFNLTISLNNILPVNGLYATTLNPIKFNVINPTDTLTIYVPLFEGSDSAKEQYKKYVISIGGVPVNVPSNGLLPPNKVLAYSLLPPGEVPQDDIFLEVNTGTYTSLYFSSLNGTSSGTSGAKNRPLTLSMKILGDASVTNFISDGLGLLGWSSPSSSILMYSDINIDVDTSEGVAFINLTGESNSIGSFKVVGNLTANILSGEIRSDSASGDSEPCSICSGCKGMILVGDITFNIGSLEYKDKKPVINGAIVGSLEYRNGNAYGTHTGNITINLYNGVYNGNIYAIGRKGQTVCTYTVNYFGGEFGTSKKIKLSEGGTIYGDKILNIKGSGELSSASVEYTKFNFINIDPDAKFILSGDIELGHSTISNNGLLEFSDVSNCTVYDKEVKENSTISEDNTVITSKVIISSGGTYINWESLGPNFSIDSGKLVYTISALINGWDSNWGVFGLLNSPNTDNLPVGESLVDSIYLPNYPEYVDENGSTRIKLTEGSATGNCEIFGGSLSQAFTGNTWIYSDGGTYTKLIGGTSSHGSRANFTGNAHIYINNTSVNHIYGGIHADAGNPIMNGSSFITIGHNTNINGWIVGGNVSWHSGTTTLNGNTNVLVNTILTGTLVPSDQNGPPAADTAIIGGNAWLRNVQCTSTLNGNTIVNVHITDDSFTEDNKTFTKIITGGSLIGGLLSSNKSYGYVNGDTSVVINIDTLETITFSNKIIGSGLLEGACANTYIHGGSSSVEINGGLYTNCVIGNSYVKSGISTTSGNSTLIIKGGVFNNYVIAGGYAERGQSITINGVTSINIYSGTFNGTLIGGSYESSGGSTIKSGDINININGGQFSTIVGGHYTTGDGVTASTDISVDTITMVISGASVVEGPIYGGIVLQRKAGASDKMYQNSVNIILDTVTINNNIYVAGGDFITEAATSVLNTVTTRLGISNNTVLKDGITISGGYFGLDNSPESVIEGDKILALYGTENYDLSRINTIDFSTIEIVNENAEINIGVSLDSIGINKKTGKGTYKLLPNETLQTFNVNEGTLNLGENVSAESIYVNNTATVKSTMSTVAARIIFNAGSTLDVEDGYLTMLNGGSIEITGAINILLKSDKEQTKNYYSIKIAEGVSSVTIGGEELQEGQYVKAESYIHTIIDSEDKGIDFSNSYFKYFNSCLYINVNDASTIKLDSVSEVEYVMNDLTGGSLFIVKYDKSLLTDNMIIDIKTFINREKPLGSFIAYSDDVIDV